MISDYEVDTEEDTYRTMKSKMSSTTNNTMYNGINNNDYIYEEDELIKPSFMKNYSLEKKS